MFCGGELQGSGGMARPRKIDHADMLMRGADPMDIEKAGSKQRPGSRFCGGRPFAEEFNLKPAFFTRFTQRSLFRIFVELNMPAERQPPVQRPMMDQQNLRLLDYKDRDGEIDLIVNMRHGVSPCAPRQDRAGKLGPIADGLVETELPGLCRIAR